MIFILYIFHFLCIIKKEKKDIYIEFVYKLNGNR